MSKALVLKNDQLIHEFYEREFDNFPDLTLDQFKEVIFGPWQHLKTTMEDGELDSMRLKYFGLFQVYEGRAKNMLKNNEIKRSNGNITESQYEKFKLILERFLAKKALSNS